MDFPGDVLTYGKMGSRSAAAIWFVDLSGHALRMVARPTSIACTYKYAGNGPMLESCRLRGFDGEPQRGRTMLDAFVAPLVLRRRQACF